MSCNHCKMLVEKTLAKINGVKSFTVDLDKGEAHIAGNPDVNLIINEINNLGYQAILTE